jgi:hypothetical protein
MSIITSIIVSIHGAEDFSRARIDQLNDWLEQYGHKTFQTEEDLSVRSRFPVRACHPEIFEN